MKKQWTYWILAGVLAAVPGTSAAYATEEEEAISVPLDAFETEEGAYQFDSYEWGSPMEEVLEEFPYTMAELLMAKDSNPEGLDYYIAEEPFALDGQPAELRLEFQEEKLKEVRFSFKLDDSYAEWYETQVQELTGLYGKPDRQTVNTLDALGMTNWSCAWDTEETSLQFLLITREHGEATAVLGAAEMSRETGA